MFAAVDIGGTKTLVAVFTTDGKIKEEVKFPTPQDYEEFKITLEKTVAGLSTKEFQRTVVAAPGLINRKKGIVLAFGNLPWINTPLGPDLEKIFHVPVMIENDTKLAALSESILAPKKYHKVLYVTVSTGISAGYVLDGKLDPHFTDMEPGHMLLEYGDRLERWEKFASGKAVYEKYGQKFSDITDPKIWYVVARNIALGLVALIATLTPEVIIIGGGAGKHLAKFKDQLDEHLKLYEHPMLQMPVILPAKRPEEAVIYGCYELAKQHYAK